MTRDIPANPSAPSDPARPAIAPALFAYALLYGGMGVIAGVLGNKQIALGPLAFEAGLLAFVQLLIIGGAVAELYGKSVGNRLVLFGFIPLIVSMALTVLIMALPPADAMPVERREAVALLLGTNLRIWTAGLVAYGVSQLLNITLIGAIRDRFGGPLWLRGGVAAALSEIVNGFVFILGAFYGAVDPIMPLLAGQIAAKLVLAFALVPPAVSLLVWLGHRLDRRA